MNITTSLDRYKKLGDYFAPDYDRDNEVLSEFKKLYPILTKTQVQELKNILESKSEWTDKFFVADLLYLYETFDKELLEPLVECAIYLKDPSFNRILLNPCIVSFGTRTVAQLLNEKFVTGDIVKRIGISKLIYWLGPHDNGETDILMNTILSKANETKNLVELYFYMLSYSDDIKVELNIPRDASELENAIKGNKELEDLLYNTLDWPKHNAS